MNSYKELIMAIVKRYKANWFDEKVELISDTIKIGLNKTGLFEYDVPQWYKVIFEEFKGGRFDLPEAKYQGGKVTFCMLSQFQGSFDRINWEFKQLASQKIEERVLVIQCRMKAFGNGVHIDRDRWSNNDAIGTLIDFDYERGIKVGNVIYKTYNSKSWDNEKGWERHGNTFKLNQGGRNRDNFDFIIPFTKERESFFHSIDKELISLISRLEAFLSSVTTPETLALIDNGGMIKLLGLPEQISDAEVVIDSNGEDK